MSRKLPDPPDDELVQRLRRALEILGLKHTLAQLDEHLAWATTQRPAYAALLEHVLGEEANTRLAQRIERRLDTCGLRERKTLEAFDFDFQPDLDKALIQQLALLDFVRRKEDLVFTGDPGTGKSHIFQALVVRACEQGMSVRYARGVDLLDDLYAGLADGTYRQRLKHWTRPELLVIDDVGLGQVRKRDDEPTAAHTLFNLLDSRHGQASTAITSNIPLSAWGRYLGDTTLAGAILDRLAMRAIRVHIKGPSYRQQVAKDRAQALGAKPDDDRHQPSAEAVDSDASVDKPCHER
ncbi:MAG: ATP-binding protein [Deltaproteobacteria bacterium]|nr:ATP-binding protein [Deltaproteobacteria bacterium]